MSRYLSHLAALALNRLEPLQPRPASRFETPFDEATSGLRGVDAVQERPEIAPKPAQTLKSATVADSPYAHRAVTPDDGDNPLKKIAGRQDESKVVERGEAIVKQAQAPVDRQQLSPSRSFSADAAEPTHHPVPFADKAPIELPRLRKNAQPTETGHTIVERVREYFTETLHSERVVKEVALADGIQTTVSVQAAQHPEPAKPTGVIIRPEQTPANPGAPVRAPAQTIFDNAETRPGPTVQVTIGRIEIRATQSQGKAAAKPHAAAAMNLDDYLKQRNGGRT